MLFSAFLSFFSVPFICLRAHFCCFAHFICCIVLTHLIIIIFHVRARDALTRSPLSFSIYMSFFTITLLVQRWHIPCMDVRVRMCVFASACEWMCLYAKTQAIKISPIYLFYSFGSRSRSAIHTVWLDGWSLLTRLSLLLLLLLAVSYDDSLHFVLYRIKICTRCSWAVQIYTNAHALARTLNFCHRKTYKTSKCSSSNNHQHQNRSHTQNSFT